MTEDGGRGGVRQANRAQLLELLARSAPLSRAEVSRVTGLSRATVSSIVRELLAEDSVQEVVGRQDGGRRPAGARGGRPPTLLSLAGAPRVLLAVDIGHRHVHTAVAGLDATILAEHRLDLDVDHEATLTLDRATTLVHRCMADAEVVAEQVVGVGMGAPGPIDPRSGTIGSPILPGWTGRTPARELADRLGLAVRADNDANIGALAEHEYGAARGQEDVIYVKVAGGIGAGLILAGRLHRGVTGIAGEIGHVRTQDDGPACRCGSRGCLETQVAAPRLVELLRPAYGVQLTVEEMLGLARSEDAGVNRILDDAGRAIGRVLADLSNHLNPGVIVVGGDLGDSASLLHGIRDSVDRYAQPDTAAALEVVPGRLGQRAGVIGALVLAKDTTVALGHVYEPA